MNIKSKIMVFCLCIFFVCCIHINNVNASQGNSEISISYQPENVTCKAGTSMTWKIEAAGKNLKYQWQYNMGGTGWYNFGDGTGTSITRSIPESWNGWKIRCVVSDSTGAKKISSESVITIGREIEITKQPENVSCKAGTSTTWKIEAAGENLKYQWQYNMGGTGWYNFGDGTGTSITRSIPATWNRWKIRCVVTDLYGNTIVSSTSNIYIISSEEWELPIV